MALPAPRDGSTALVTGASAGIGAEIARELARRGHDVTLVARREERLRELAAELAAEHGVEARAIACDLAAAPERDRLAAALDDLGLAVEVLVNNAGFGDRGPVHRSDRLRLLEMVRLNCEALLDLQARYTPAMVERGRGAVLNVASTAAFQPIPGTATYAATKAFALSLTEASNSDLGGTGVSITALCPGPVRTEFVEAAGLGAAERTLPGMFWAAAADVAREAVDGMEHGRRVVVPGLVNRAGALTGQHTPRMLLLPLAKRLWRRGTE